MMLRALCVCGCLALLACERQPDSARTEEAGVTATDTRLEALLGGSAQDGFELAATPRAFEFPRDHGPHPTFRHEWWYFTGHLDGANGERFGFELTFFRFALTPKSPAIEQSSRWRSNQVYVAHFAITDQARQTFHSAERREREALELAGATAEPLRVWVQNWSLASSDTGWQLSATDSAYALLLDVESAGPPVLNGDQGLSRKSAAPGAASYYYSIPRLTARGELRRAGTPLAVTGTAWLDREWGSGALAQDQQGWDWFALQLEDGSALMFYRLRRRDGARDPFSAGTWTDANGRSRHLAATEVAITELERWQSPRGGSYPARWRLRLEQPHLDLELYPVLADQELDTSPRYWEGAVEVRGRHAGRPIIGRGYVELTGYAGDR
jgi:predicted secreted hydrolase